MPKRDRLDIGEPQRKAWEEFAIQFSASRLMSLLLAKIQDLVPEFFAELKQEFDDAYANSDNLADEGEGWDPDWVTLTTPAYEFWTDRAGAAELYEQLFPHADKDLAMEGTGRGLALVGLHSAMEHYFTALTGTSAHETLPRRIGKYLGPKISSETYEALIRLDESRHVIIHHRGIVSDKYITNVAYGRYFAGEKRTISDAELWKLGDLVWDIAVKLRAEAELRANDG